MKSANTRLQQLINGALVVAVIGLLGYLSWQHKINIDWTANQRNTITQASRAQLAAMPDTLRFVAFTYPGAEDRAFIEYQVDKYRRFHPDIQLEWVDPSANPQKVRDYGVSFAGQVALEYQGRRELLGQLDEPGITGALQRLSFAGETWIVFLEGHGERSTSGNGNESYARLAALLRDKGLKVQSLNLVATPSIPDNTAVLVVASPRSALFEGEEKLIDDWVAGGGNLLWLADPDQEPGLAPLAQRLGIHWLPGFAVFPEYQMIGTGHPGIVAALDYPSNPVTRGLDRVTVFPFARALGGAGSDGWVSAPMLTTLPSAWRETGAMDQDSVAFDDGSDGAGPLTVGVTLTRDAPAPAPAEGEPAAGAREQRVALLGDADFLSDAYIAEGGNQQLGLNLLQWLAERDSQLNIDVPKAPDLTLDLPAWGLSLLTAGFVLLLPLLLIGTGVGRWMLRRRR